MKLPPEIESAVQSLMTAHGGIGSVEFLPLPRRIADHVEKAIVFTPKARPVLLVMLAPPAYPDCVHDALQRAAAARRALGDDVIGAAVQVALCQGFVDRQSFAVVPYLTPMGRGRLRRRWHRFRLRRPAFDWLREVTRRTIMLPPREAHVGSVLTPLLALSRMERVGERVRQAATGSLRELEGGRWEPQWVLAHNDLWVGNFLRRRPDPAGVPSFAVIDWGASQIRGFPVYDLLAIASSINLSTASLRRELRQYCAVLGCEPAQARHHLLLALGTLSLSLGEWPVERFAKRAQAFLTYLEAVQ
jgi:hypothetical protein